MPSRANALKTASANHFQPVALRQEEFLPLQADTSPINSRAKSSLVQALRRRQDVKLADAKGSSIIFLRISTLGRKSCPRKMG